MTMMLLVADAAHDGDDDTIRLLEGDLDVVGTGGSDARDADKQK